MTKKLLFTLAAIAMLSVSCGDDKKEEKSDDKDKKESSEAKPESKKLDLCGCVDATKEAYLKGEDIPGTLDEECEELFANTPNAQEALQDCPNFQELMELSAGDDMEDLEEDLEEEYSAEDMSCEEILEEYDEFLAEFKEIESTYKANQDDPEAQAAYVEISTKAATFISSFGTSPCLTDENFMAEMEAINEKYEIPN